MGRVGEKVWQVGVLFLLIMFVGKATMARVDSGSERFVGRVSPEIRGRCWMRITESKGPKALCH